MFTETKNTVRDGAFNLLGSKLSRKAVLRNIQLCSKTLFFKCCHFYFKSSNFHVEFVNLWNIQWMWKWAWIIQPEASLKVPTILTNWNQNSGSVANSADWNTFIRKCSLLMFKTKRVNKVWSFFYKSDKFWPPILKQQNFIGLRAAKISTLWKHCVKILSFCQENLKHWDYN
jgi:hypothetical protein